MTAEVPINPGISSDVLIVRKLGVPGHEEFASGTIASGGNQILDKITGQPISSLQNHSRAS